MSEQQLAGYCIHKWLSLDGPCPECAEAKAMNEPTPPQPTPKRECPHCHGSLERYEDPVAVKLLATERAAREQAEVIARMNSEYARAYELQAKDAEYMGNLLAIIHCDGGHYRAEHGTVKATDDAIEIVSGLKRDKEQAESERDSARRFADILLGNLDSIRIATEYLDEGTGANTATALAIKDAGLVKDLRREVAELKGRLRVATKTFENIRQRTGQAGYDSGDSDLHFIVCHALAQLSEPAREEGK